MKKGRVIVTPGTFRDANGASLTFDEALDEKAKCCGFSCCEELIRIPDQTTGTTVELYFDDGNLKFDIGELTYVVSTTGGEE